MTKPRLSTEPSLLTGLAELLRRRSVILAWGLVGALICGAVLLAVGPRYTATAEMAILSSKGAGLTPSLANIAAQLNIGAPSSVGQTPGFYEALARTRELLARILRKRYPTRRDSVELLTYLDGDESPRGLMKAMRKLQRAIVIDVDSRTGVIRIGVGMADPVAAAAVANEFVSQLSLFHAELRRREAAQRRSFFEEQVAEAQEHLDAAERLLRDFYLTNRQWAASPALTYQEGLLRRRVQLASDLYLSLNRDLQVARLEEVNTTPSLQLIDAAVTPAEPDRVPIVWLLFGLLLGAVLGAIWVLTLGWLRWLAERRVPEAEYIVEKWKSLKARIHVEG